MTTTALDTVNAATDAACADTKTHDFFRDLRTLVPLKNLQALDPDEIEFVGMKINGATDKQIKTSLGFSKAKIQTFNKREPVKLAIAHACWALRSGVLTASEVAQAAEAEIMLDFYKIATADETPLEWRYRFGSKILDHRKELLKAMPFPPAVSGINQPEIIEIESKVRERLSTHLKSLPGASFEQLKQKLSGPDASLKTLEQTTLGRSTAEGAVEPVELEEVADG